MAPSRTPVRVALMNDYDIVVQGLGRMFEPYRDRVHLVELDARMPVQRSVDIAMYDTFSQDQADHAAIAAAARRNENLGLVEKLHG